MNTLAHRKTLPTLEAFVDGIVAGTKRLDTSGKMMAIFGYITGKVLTDPAIAEIIITSDGMVLARNSGDIGANDFIGSQSDLIRNIKGLCEVLGASEEETKNACRNVTEPLISSLLHR
jgi:hypothetical protein